MTIAPGYYPTTNQLMPPKGEREPMGHYYLRVKTLNEEHQIDLGADQARAHAILEEAKKLMQETGAVTIAGGLVVNASDIESMSIHDQPLTTEPNARN